MSNAPLESNDPLPEGLYEALVTESLPAALEALQQQGLTPRFEKVDPNDVPHVLARHVGRLATDIFKVLKPESRVSFANALLQLLASQTQQTVPLLAEGPQQLVALTREEAPGVHRVHEVRPSTPLSDTALLTNGPDEPALVSELRSEMASADRVDLLCAFVRWTGVRLFGDQLRRNRERGVPLRVIASTYTGSTERKAIDSLIRKYGAEVRISYETKATRLHAKAWHFHRNSGFDTAYVGSSNLTYSALVEGLEWNFRMSSVTTPAALSKFAATFETYWNSREFEPYNPDNPDDVARLDAALQRAGNADKAPLVGGASLRNIEFHPYPHQAEILERLAVERQVHDRHSNLVVAATGTGKTVVAALDYRGLRERLPQPCRLLFIAHRKEILEQSRATYRNVLGDATFGELYVDGHKPEEWNHVFASVQSLQRYGVGRIPADHFDVVVIDEFHHAEARTYREVLAHLSPKEMLGLTATPERADGANVQDTFFGGRIAAELRLWDAMAAELLCPFHYFGIHDGVNLSDVEWKRGAYVPEALDARYIGNDARSRVILEQLDEKVTNPQRMRAIGFCVSVNHARYMTRVFNEAGINARTVVGDTPREERHHSLEALRKGDIQALFTVDLLNEGLDIPEVDTVLLLRPTQSSTIFLQQLGRGLRRAPNKAVLTILDFIGQQRREFRFEERFRALTGQSHKGLERQVAEGFPKAPPGCQIVLDRIAQQIVLENIKEQLKVTTKQLVRELVAYGRPSLSDYLQQSGRNLRSVYIGTEGSWTSLRRAAGYPGLAAPSAREASLSRRMKTFWHVDDLHRANAYRRLLSDSPPSWNELTAEERGFAAMLFYALWPTGGGFATYADGLAELASEPAIRDEICSLIELGIEAAEHVPQTLPGKLADLPLRVHARYSREEILAGLGWATEGLSGKKPGNAQQGVFWISKISCDAFLITVNKNEKHFSPETMYRDYALTSSRFHWESQNTTRTTSETGHRYLNHERLGSHVLLFARHSNTYPGIDVTAPYLFLGSAKYIDHQGERPIAITWGLDFEMPVNTVQQLKVTS